MKTLSLLVACSFGMAMSAACTEPLECGKGTIEKDGQCVTTFNPNYTGCGPGTHYDTPSGTCVSDELANVGKCGNNTERTIGPDGIPVCVGTGIESCDDKPFCSPPDSGKLSICARVLNIKDSKVVSEDHAQKMEVLFYDALDFANSTPSTRPAPLARASINKCGYVLAKNVPLPATKFLAIGTEDSSSGADDFITTGVTLAVTAGTTYEDLRAYYTTPDTEQAWTQSAGRSEPFSKAGAFLPIFINTKGTPASPYPGALVQGVKISNTFGINAQNDFYFSDTNPTERTTVNPALEATGANGSGLYTNVDPADYGGSGPSGCTWTSSLLKPVEGVIVVREYRAECN
ncbi:MAG: hypothetical protein HY698_04210 [Deltaproteobacteria bacterium]|nr:hypothetical protein [Deltaproteobacteria bacterium]